MINTNEGPDLFFAHLGKRVLHSMGILFHSLFYLPAIVPAYGGIYVLQQRKL